MNKRFRLSSSLTSTLSGLSLVDSFDTIADGIAAADTLALEARFNGVPLKLIVVADAYAGRIAYRTRA